MRTLGIDLGTRRVGLALSDAGGKLATPLEVLHITSPQQASDRVMDVITREGAEQLVVGLPLNMDDSLGLAAEATITWGRALAERSKLPVRFVDERLSSFEAEQTLASRKQSGEKLTHKRKRQQLDAVAAAAVLQAFLDGKLPAIEP